MPKITIEFDKKLLKEVKELCKKYKITLDFFLQGLCKYYMRKDLELILKEVES